MNVKITVLRALLLISIILVLAEHGSIIPYTQAQLTDNWHMSGHDNAHASRSSFDGPLYPKLKWALNLNVTLQNPSPVVDSDGTAYVASEDRFFAINSNGTVKWTKENIKTRMSPAVANDESAVYVYDTWSYKLLALDTANGSTLWHYDIGYATYGSPTIGSDGTIYIGGSPSPVNGTSIMYALNPNGSLKWNWTMGPPSFWIESSPAIGPNGDVYFQHNNFGVVALNSSGGFMWNHDGKLGQVWNSLSVGSDGTLYIGSSDHFFYALDPNGTIKWKVGVDNFMYESSCAISADGATIYRGDNGGVFYAFDKSGFIKWKYDTGIEGMISVSPALSANGIIYFTTGWSTSVKPTDKGYLYALRASDGILLWKYEVDWSSCAPALANGNLYVVGKNGSDFGVLYSFTTESYESLTSEYTVEFGGTQFACSITSKSTTSNFVFNQSLRKISFNLTTNELDGYCNVMFPTQLLGGPYAVGIDGLPAEATESSNATCTSLYITYTQGNHTIEVLGTSAIPEFLTTPTIMLLLFSLPTVLFLQQRKKLKHRAALPHSAT